MPARSPERLLEELRRRGARRLSKVALRPNRRTIWSLTRGGTCLNLHEAYASAPPKVLDAFVVIVNEARKGTNAYREAARRVRSWPGLEPGLRKARQAAARRRSAAKIGRRPRGPGRPAGPCCGTEEQVSYLRVLYRYFNRSRFGGRLPEDVHLRWSSRMKSRLGQMTPGRTRDGRRRIREIALNVDLLLPGNDAERIDTLLHEMAHAVDYLMNGALGHGGSWRRWAHRAGCQPTACATDDIVRRPDGAPPVRRVPPLPRGASARAA